MTYTLTVDAEHKRVRLTGAGKSETAQVHCIRGAAFNALTKRFLDKCRNAGVRVRIDFAPIP